MAILIDGLDMPEQGEFKHLRIYDNSDVTVEVEDGEAVIAHAIPAADVRPVVKAQWDDKPVAFFLKCTECGCCVGHRYDVFLDRGELNFCPNCGAMMEGS